MPSSPDAEEQGDGQHRQAGIAPQLDVVLEHPRPEGQGAGARLHLEMDQGHQVGRRLRGAAGRRAAASAGHQVELPSSRLAAVPGRVPCPASRCRRTRTAPPSRGRSKEEGLEELLDQDLEALVVIGCVGLRHDRVPVAPEPEGRDRRTTGQSFGSEATRHATRLPTRASYLTSAPTPLPGLTGEPSSSSWDLVARGRPP